MLVPGFEIPCSIPPPGLILLKDVISEAEEETLLDSIQWDETQPDLSQSKSAPIILGI